MIHQFKRERIGFPLVQFLLHWDWINDKQMCGLVLAIKFKLNPQKSQTCVGWIIVNHDKLGYSGMGKKRSSRFDGVWNKNGALYLAAQHVVELKKPILLGYGSFGSIEGAPDGRDIWPGFFVFSLLWCTMDGPCATSKVYCTILFKHGNKALNSQRV